MAIREPHLAEPFQTAAQQHEAASLGMWLFLATEIMLFGVLFLVIAYYRLRSAQAVAEAVGHLHALLAGANSALLLTGSLCMSLMVQAARQGQCRRVQRLLLLSAALGGGFLALKGFEYAWEYRDGLLPGIGKESPLARPAARLYFNLYLLATALHALHVGIAVLLALGMAAGVRAGRLRLPARATLPEMAGLYWHLVDMLWIFLYPSLYLLGRPA